ncbi:MAG: YicC family protein [Bdellovibrionales bacterium]|nr:YicC family protein [Bdellovibrionales bacterium]
MIYSMTGFGRGETIFKGKRFIVEMKSLNSRYCEINVNAPREFAMIEHEVIQKTKRRFVRGKIDIYLRLEQEQPVMDSVDEELLIEKWCKLEKIRKKIKQASPILIESVLSYAKPNASSSFNDKKTLECFLKTLDQAVSNLTASRLKEGRELVKSIQKRLTALQMSLALIQTQIPKTQTQKQQALWAKLDKILNERSIDRRRVETEIALLLEKADITEETERLAIHLKRFGKMTRQSGPIGREMDFMIQEMNREINTVGSKAGDYDISKEVIFVKAELEKIREQVQNLE